MSRKFRKHIDGSTVDDKGNIVFFSLKRFINDICKGNNCFLCGTQKTSFAFNDEHIIPKWVLKKYDLFNKSITLPNDEKIRYDKYKIPCCIECNSFLGNVLEKDIQKLVETGYNGLIQQIDDEKIWNIFLWLSLIFFKTHYKDSFLRKHLDQRKGDESISESYEWGFLHHIHAMVTALKNGNSISRECLGSLLVLPAKLSENYHDFDYRDIYEANTILLRMGDIAFLAVLDDSCAASNFFQNHFEKIDGPLSPIQLRETLSHLTLLNFKLKYRPQYGTKIDTNENKVTIVAELPEKLELDDFTSSEFGEILYSNTYEMIEKINDERLNKNIENLKAGYFRFLFDENGKFMNNCMEIVKMDEQLSSNKHET